MGCQVLRGSEARAYDWLGQCQETGIICCVNPCKPCYDQEGVLQMPEKNLNDVVKDVGGAADSAAKKMGSNTKH